MEVAPEYVGYRKAEKRWGSCSPSNRISFNYHLMKLSSSLIEYVVIHELAHIRHKNHSQEFWAEVKRFLPEYRSKDEKIKGFEKLF
jgi:predicted metal-dependent hydrolase